mgnify:CR=1 FL=1
MKTLSRHIHYGFSVSDKFKIFCAYIYLYVQAKAGFLPSLSIKINFNFAQGRASFVITEISDFWTIQDIFYDEQYRIRSSYVPKTILDLGSNIGISVVYFSLMYPNAHIYAFEPNKDAFKMLELHTKHLPQVHLFNAALSNTDGMVDLYTSEHSTHGSLIASHGIKQSVESVTLPKLLDRTGVAVFDFVKFDIEGAEDVLFEAIDVLKDTSVFVGEMHYDRMSLAAEDVAKFFPGYRKEENFFKQKKRSIIYIEKSV